MKRLTYKNRITSLIIVIVFSAIAVIGCGNQTAATHPEESESSVVSGEATSDATETTLAKPKDGSFSY